MRDREICVCERVSIVSDKVPCTPLTLSAASLAFQLLTASGKNTGMQALKQFGSGWAWLSVRKGTGGLEVSATKNQGDGGPCVCL